MPVSWKMIQFLLESSVKMLFCILIWNSVWESFKSFKRFRGDLTVFKVIKNVASWTPASCDINEFLIYTKTVSHRWWWQVLKQDWALRRRQNHVGTFNEIFLIHRLNESSNSILPFNWFSFSGAEIVFHPPLEALIISSHFPLFCCCFAYAGGCECSVSTKINIMLLCERIKRI